MSNEKKTNDGSESVDVPQASDSASASAERDAVADLLDDLLQVIAEGTRGGLNRVPTRERLAGSAWSSRFAELSNETAASIRMLRTKNVRSAARARQQQSKRRGIVKS